MQTFTDILLMVSLMVALVFIIIGGSAVRNELDGGHMLDNRWACTKYSEWTIHGSKAERDCLQYTWGGK